MPSQKSMPALVAGRAPQRRRGKLRVAALMQAGAAVFAERGFEAATMTEIAARAAAPIGSLYQFFPSKEALADALLQQYAALVEATLRGIRARAAGLPADKLADALVAVFLGLRQQRRAAIALLDARAEWSVRLIEVRDLIRHEVAAILTTHDGTLSARLAGDMATVLLVTMKAMAALDAQPGAVAGPGALAELRRMARLYLSDRLGRSRA